MVQRKEIHFAVPDESIEIDPAEITGRITLRLRNEEGGYQQDRSRTERIAAVVEAVIGFPLQGQIKTAPGNDPEFLPEIFCFPAFIQHFPLCCLQINM